MALSTNARAVSQAGSLDLRQGFVRPDGGGISQGCKEGEAGLLDRVLSEVGQHVAPRLPAGAPRGRPRRGPVIAGHQSPDRCSTWETKATPFERVIGKPIQAMTWQEITAARPKVQAIDRRCGERPLFHQDAPRLRQRARRSRRSIRTPPRAPSIWSATRSTSRCPWPPIWESRSTRPSR